jgi:hypothetical protein
VLWSSNTYACPSLVVQMALARVSRERRPIVGA